MTVRRLDPTTGGIVTSGVQFIRGRDEIAQTVRTRLRLFLGEYFRDITIGTPWFQSILVKSTTLSSKDAQLKRVITQTPGVTQLLDFNADYVIETRRYTITGQILTPFGVVSLDLGGTI